MGNILNAQMKKETKQETAVNIKCITSAVVKPERTSLSLGRRRYIKTQLSVSKSRQVDMYRNGYVISQEEIEEYHQGTKEGEKRALIWGIL